MPKNIKYQPQLVLEKAIMLKLQINKDLEQLNINSNIKTELEHNTELILKTI